MKTYLITGGAGFIGTNAADFFLTRGDRVIVFDDLSRAGTNTNLMWLQAKNSDRLEFVKGDIRTDIDTLSRCADRADFVLHLAAQVAVTTSVVNPREDFEINALGTFNVLEAIRLSSKKPALLYSSTNKVYGGMEDVGVEERNNRYEYTDLPHGASEERLLDFHSPYGCSKGAADQYVRDYSRIYGLKTIVFRQSCIYGYRQFGIEDQGWVAWFTIAATLNKAITLYGDGKQIRDILFIDDLVRAFDAAFNALDVTSGQIYNIGGGPSNTMSLLELLSFLETFLSKKIQISQADWRPGDQKVFVADIRKAHHDFGWQPAVTVEQGIEKLYRWVVEHQSLFADL